MHKHTDYFFAFQVVRRANDVQYGLSACVWTENSGITHRVSQALDVSRFFFWPVDANIVMFQVGTVWVNCWLVRDLNVPFGGAKMSGVGREGIQDSLDFYTEKKTICIKY